MAAAGADPELEFVAEEMERLIDRLRTDTMSMRMPPVGSTFACFRRLVRDLSRELGKEVELATEGADTELDKNVIEQFERSAGTHAAARSVIWSGHCANRR